MSIFNNLISGLAIAAPEILIRKLTLMSTYQINERETKIFEFALLGIADCLREEGFKEENLCNAVILITKDGYFEHRLLKNELHFGIKLNLIVFCVQQWRNPKYINDGNLILMIFLEELIHHFWNTDDEVFVKEKAIKIINKLFPERTFKLSDFFNKEYLNNELIKNGKLPRF
jgi:hypothetical protein